MSGNMYPVTWRHVPEERVPHFVCFHSFEPCQLSLSALLSPVYTPGSNWMTVYFPYMIFLFLFLILSHFANSMSTGWRHCQHGVSVLYWAAKLKIRFLPFYVRFLNIVLCVETVILNVRAICVYAFHFWILEALISLTFESLAVSLCSTRFNIQKFYMALAFRWVFCTDIRTDRDFCFIHH
jgi:hypothetical protein